MRGVRIGDLDRRLTIQHEVNSTNEFNEKIPTWENLVTVWCSLKEALGNEPFVGDQANDVRTVVFRIRYRTDLDIKMRGVCEGNTYNFVSLIEPPGFRRQLLEIRAELDMP